MRRFLPLIIVWAVVPVLSLPAQGIASIDTIKTDTSITIWDYYIDIPFGQTFINPTNCTGYSLVKAKSFDPSVRKSVKAGKMENRGVAYISWGTPSGSNTEGTLVEHSQQSRQMRNSVSSLDYSNQTIENNLLELRHESETPMNLVMSLGMGSARLNLTNLHIRSADISTAETNLIVLFSQPNHCRMSDFHIKGGNSEILLRNIENANAEKVVIENGMGTTTIVLGATIPYPTQLVLEVGAGECEVSITETTPVKIVVKDNNVSSVEVPADFKSAGSNVLVNPAYEKNPGKSVVITVDLGMGSFKVIPYRQ